VGVRIRAFCEASKDSVNPEQGARNELRERRGHTLMGWSKHGGRLVEDSDRVELEGRLPSKGSVVELYASSLLRNRGNRYDAKLALSRID
jgi:hypothetical protein